MSRILGSESTNTMLGLKSRLEAAFDDTDGLVDTIITSPPYADLVDYGDHEEQVGKQDYEDFAGSSISL